MKSTSLPFTKGEMEEIIKKHPTPFHIYDEEGIKKTSRDLKQAFSWADKKGGFKEYFAVKATPNPHILKMLKDEGFGADCSSLPELVMSEKVGVTGEEIMFTSNDTPAEEYKEAYESNAIINLDDISHIDYLEESLGTLPELVSLRYNPGPERGGNEIIGHPEEAKYGFTKKQLIQGYKKLRKRGVKRFGIHAMIASNELEDRYFIETARMLFELVVEISNKHGIEFEFVNMGGGMGIPYKPDQEGIDFNVVSEGVKRAYEDIIQKNDKGPLKLYMENGRVITGPHGYLVAKVLHKKNTYKNFVGLDANMAHLMRPGVYGAYHHITVLGKENSPRKYTYDVTGSLCENNDKFCIDRKLPEVEVGDIIVIHDTGAHGYAMGFNYNGKLRSAELLLRPDKSVKKIRRRETIEDYFATLDFSNLG